jgi:hypothetical protein
MEEKAQSQRYLTLREEKAFVKFLCRPLPPLVHPILTLFERRARQAQSTYGP